MKILFINNFLFTVGGVETYIKSVSDELLKKGNQVEFFGMYDSRNTFKNNYGLYSRPIDLKTKNIFNLLKYSLRIFYSFYNKRQLTKLLKLMKPDLIHLNNINFNLTTSILDPLIKLKIPIIKTIHDAQITCVNHRTLIPKSNLPCTKCKNGNFSHSFVNKCVDNSTLKSFIGMLESYFNHLFRRYLKIDLFIFPSRFMLENHSHIGLDKSKFTFIPNFARLTISKQSLSASTLDSLKFRNFNLYFGRLSHEKGIHLILRLAKDFPNENFLFIGHGPLKDKIPKDQANIQLIDFISDNDVLAEIITLSKLTLCPSIWYENSPLNLIESLNLNTPVLASEIGGIPEFIQNGKNGILFKSGDYNDFSIKFKEAVKLKSRFNSSSPSIEVLSVEKYVDILCSKYKILLSS